MTPRLASMIDGLRQRLPLRGVALLPGELFYCHSFDIPENTPADALEDFAELSLEAASPFPIEGLAWGFIQQDQERILVFAASNDRLVQRGYETLADAWQGLPSFAPMIGQRVERDTIRFTSAGETLSALFIPAGSGVPVRVVSRPLNGLGKEALPATLLGLRKKLADSLEAGSHTIEEGIWRCTETHVVGEERLAFTLTRITGAGTTETRHIDWPYGGTQIWNADVRGRSFAQSKRQERKRALLLWRGMLAAGVFAALLLLSQLGLFGWRLWTSSLENRATARDPLVMQLQSKDNFANVLESVTEREMKPFSMIQAANAVRAETPSVYFKRISSSDWNVLRLEGEGGRAEEVTRYIQSLRNSDFVENVRNVRTESRGGSTTFDIEAVFHPLPDISPPPLPEQPAGEEGTEEPATEGDI